MAQPYGRSDHGMHFPLHKGTEVLLTCIDGDPDRPIIQAAVPNPETPSLVNDASQTQCRITTSGQNRIHMEDEQGREQRLSSQVDALEATKNSMMMRQPLLAGETSKLVAQTSKLAGTVDDMYGELNTLEGLHSQLRGEVSELAGEGNAIVGTMAKNIGSTTRLLGETSTVSGETSDIAGELNTIAGLVNIL